MARGKKTENALTPEEKLAQALVPDWEQPYKVPGNWCWTTLSYLVETSKEKTEDFSDPDVKYIGLEHIEKDVGIIGHSSAAGVRSLKNVFYSGQILYGKLRPYLNKHDIADFNGVCSTDILVFNTKKTTLAQYVNFYLNQKDFVEYAVSNSKGINLPRVSESAVLDAVCPLPPLPEQQRIVDRIESLFAKLDEAKEKVQTVLDSFETRKAAILHKAFTGELTAKWRAEHGVGMESWEHQTLDAIADRIFDGPFGSNLKSDDYVSSGIRVVRLENLKNLWFDDSKQSFVSEEKYSTINKHTVYPSDLIMSTFIADETKVCQMPAYVKYAVNKADCIGIRLKNTVNTRYVLYFLSSRDVFVMLQRQIHGATRPRVNSKQIKSIPVSLPNILEQTEIVRILDSLFAKEQQAKEAAEAVLEQIDLLKKSILARAFRGELGTNDPSEESAAELVKAAILRINKIS